MERCSPHPECQHCEGVAGAHATAGKPSQVQAGRDVQPRVAAMQRLPALSTPAGSLLPYQSGRLPAGVGQVTYSCSDGSDESTCENTCDQISLMDSLCYCGSACTNVTQVGLLDVALVLHIKSDLAQAGAVLLTSILN